MNFGFQATLALFATTVLCHPAQPVHLAGASLSPNFAPFPNAPDSDQQRLFAPLATGSKPVMPPPGSVSSSGGANSGPVTLSDTMGRDRSINVFAGLARDVEAVALRLDDAARNTTVLAPLNSAMDKMAHKPWEVAREYGALGAAAYEGEDGLERARQNIRRFVEAHIVPASPWPAGAKTHALGGEGDVWWEEKDGGKVIQPGDIKVVSVASTVTNGQVWIIDCVLNPE